MTDPASDDVFRWWREPRISWFVYLFIIGFCVVSVMVYYTRDRRESRYSIVFDAKENATRVQLFRLGWREGHWSLRNEEYGSVSPSLTQFFDEPQRGAFNLLKLFVEARNAIPESHQAVSTVALGVAEAFHEFEERNDTRINTLFRTINLFFRSRVSPFRKTFVSSINATDEIVYTWSAISLLRKTLGKKVAVLNLGRYRCQICFVPETMDPTMKFVRFQKNVDLYVKNYNRLGIDHARVEITKKAGPAVCDSNVPVAHAHRFRTCLDAVKTWLADVKIEPMPDLGREMEKEIYVRGFFFNLAIYGGLIQEHEDRQTIKVRYIGSRAEAACKDNSGASSICFELTYMYTLFTEAYSIDEERELIFVRRMGNAFTSWTLGFAIAHVYD